ncbi:MAG TPA: protein-L-isoaspartate(D-aspartate) O-methyltransferase [Candidatus Binatia bacterium]
MSAALLASGLAAALLVGLGLGVPLLGTAHAETGTPTPPAPTPSAALRGDTPEAAKLRDELVTEVARRDPWISSRVLDVLRAVPRHLFMPGAGLFEAYGNHAYPIGHGQTISQPTVVAIMTDALNLTGRERVLEVGTGSGYQAAILSRLAREVYSVEIVAPLGEEARKRLADLGFDNVHVRIGDGYQGWPEKAPFDRIILTAAPPELPAALVEQLADGGILVAPLGEVDQMLYRWTKRGGTLTRESLGAVRFVPMVPASPDESPED